MDPFTILIILVVGLGLWAVSIYNRLIKNKNMVQRFLLA
jgi:hypothetical protein